MGHDFSAYKANTILRRISRRMGLNQIDGHDTYVRFLRENPDEVEALFRELLIGVTNFFRDPESFTVLEKSVIPGLFDALEEDATFRAWVPGCSTGEEVYSLAIVLRECLDNIPKRINLQLFGTDIDKFAIEKAREGIFPASIDTHVTKARLDRFFSRDGNYFRIRKEIRDTVVFSAQDLIRDPPFSRLNLLVCRNLMIYLDAEMQKKLLPLFHYTLKPGGVLMIGSSETIGGFTDLFKALDKKWKIYGRLEIPNILRRQVVFPSGLSGMDKGPDTPPARPIVQPADFSRIVRKAILAQFAPTAVLIDAKGDILHIQGRTGKYLEAQSGPPSQNILDLARDGLRIELSSALRAAKAAGKPVTRKNIGVRTNGDIQMIHLHVHPQQTPKELSGRFLVVFEEIGCRRPDSDSAPETPAQDPAESSMITELEKELQITRESHQITIEELESSNEELKSTNEELQSSNEEMQSTNEEMESSKEELQSLNEELQTVNAELQSKVDELSAARDDMKNLLNGTEIATIFVDNDLRVRRFTHEATAIVNLIHSDVGRPLQHVVTNLADDGIMADLAEVLRTLSPVEKEVRTTDGKWYTMRIMPYRTTDNRIDGGVLTFASIDAQKKSQEMLAASSRKFEEAWELVNAVFDMNPEPMAVLDAGGRVVLCNKAFSALLKQSREKLRNMDILGAQSGIPEQAGLKDRLEAALKEGAGFSTEAFSMASPEGKQMVTVQGRAIVMDVDSPYRILLHFQKNQ